MATGAQLFRLRGACHAAPKRARENEMLRHMLIAAVAVTTFAATAPAQELNPLVRERIAIAQRDQAGGGIRVQVGVNMFMPGATDDSTAADQLREQARRTVYKMAAHECDVILEVLAKECRLESINVNVNANRHYNNNNASPGYQVNGNIGLRVVLK
jgi:hypothetical protein